MNELRFGTVNFVLKLVWLSCPLRWNWPNVVEDTMNEKNECLLNVLNFGRLYHKIFRKAYGPADGADMVAAVDEKVIANYNKEAGMTCAKMIRSSTGELIIGICTPLMQRVHTLMTHSSELVFIDSTGISYLCPYIHVCIIPHSQWLSNFQRC